MLTFSFNTFAQNYISTKTTSGSGNIYHTGGNLGIGTTTPNRLIEISADYTSPLGDIPAIRLSSRLITVQSNPMYFWDIENNNKNFRLNFGYYGENENTKFQIDSIGRVSINTTSPDQSAILDINSTTFGLYNYEWNFGDGSFEFGNQSTSHYYSNYGEYQVTLLAYDGTGNYVETTKTVYVNNPNGTELTVSCYTNVDMLDPISV